MAGPVWDWIYCLGMQAQSEGAEKSLQEYGELQRVGEGH